MSENADKFVKISDVPGLADCSLSELRDGGLYMIVLPGQPQQKDFAYFNAAIQTQAEQLGITVKVFFCGQGTKIYQLGEILQR